MENYQIRLIQKKDEASVAEVIRSVMNSYDCEGEGYSIQDPEVDHMFDAYNHERAAFYVVVDKDDVVQGCGGLGPLEGAENNICELKKMYFYKSLRGLGFGKRLVQLLIADAKEIGYEHMYLETLVRMKRANVLYEKMGFKKLESTLGNTGHSQCDSYYAISLKGEN